MKPHSDRGVIGYNHYSTCYNLGMKRVLTHYILDFRVPLTVL